MVTVLFLIAVTYCPTATQALLAGHETPLIVTLLELSPPRGMASVTGVCQTPLTSSSITPASTDCAFKYMPATAQLPRDEQDWKGR